MSRTKNIEKELSVISDTLSASQQDTSLSIPIMVSALMRAVLWLLDGLKMGKTPEGKALEELCFTHKSVKDAPFYDPGNLAFIVFYINSALRGGCGRGVWISKVRRMSSVLLDLMSHHKITASIDPAKLLPGDRFEHGLRLISVKRTHTTHDVVVITTKTGEVINLPRGTDVTAFNPIELPRLGDEVEAAILMEVKHIQQCCVSIYPELIRNSPRDILLTLNTDTVLDIMPGEILSSGQHVADQFDIDPLAVVVHINDAVAYPLTQVVTSQQLINIGEDCTVIPHHPSIHQLIKLTDELMDKMDHNIIIGFIKGIDLRVTVLLDVLNSKASIREDSLQAVMLDLHACLAARFTFSSYLRTHWTKEAPGDFIFPGGLTSSFIGMDLMDVYMSVVSSAQITCEAIKTVRKVSPLKPPINVPHEKQVFLDKWKNTFTRLNPVASMDLIAGQHFLIFSDLAVLLFMESGIVKPSGGRKTTIETLEGEPSLMDNWDISTHNGMVKITNPICDAVIELKIHTNSFTGVRTVFLLTNPLTRSWSRMADVNAHGEILLINRLPPGIDRDDASIIKTCLEGPRWMLENTEVKIEIQGLCIKTNDPLVKPQDVISGVITWMN